MPAITTRINAIDALNDVAVCLDGLAYALSLQASVEGDPLAHAATDILDAKIAELRSVTAWLDTDNQPADADGQ